MEGHDIMATAIKQRQLKPQFILMALEKELREHDWTFQMSDDHGYWTNGISEQKRIKAMVEDAYAEGIDPWRLFYEFYPVEGCDGPECYGIKINWQEAMDRVAKEGECG